MFQSLFCHWYQTYYFLVRKFLIRSKYYHLVDWWRGFNQQDVTKALKGKVDLWFFNEVQESVKTMVKWCIDNKLGDTELGYTYKHYKNKL